MKKLAEIMAWLNNTHISMCNNWIKGFRLKILSFEIVSYESNPFFILWWTTQIFIILILSYLIIFGNP